MILEGMIRGKRRLCILLVIANVVSIADSLVVRQGAADEVEKVPVPCNTLTNMTIKGHDFSFLAQTVCGFWPSFLGSFPIKDTEELKDLLAEVFSTGGIYDAISGKFKAADPMYCLRQEISRKEIAIDVSRKACPSTISSLNLEEMLIDGTDDPLTKGYWSCANKTQNDCTCSRRDDRRVAPVTIKTRPGGCQMVSDEKCYGNCPAGFRPTFIKGWFRPICTSICAETNHPFACGVGCANSRVNCVKVILNQVAEIAIAASRVVSFFIGTTAITETIIAVKKVAEFALSTVQKIVELADIVFRRVAREKVSLTLLLSLFQFVREESGTIGDLVGNLAASATQLFLSIFDAEIGWKTISLQWIAGSIMEFGQTALQSAFSIANLFQVKDCTLADDTVEFTIEETGDERILGPWAQHGEVAEKPRYRLIRDRQNVMMEWSWSKRNWAIWVMDKSFGRGWWWGWLGFGWRELYFNEKNSATFPSEGWTVWEGIEPVPMLVGARNGGEE